MGRGARVRAALSPRATTHGRALLGAAALAALAAIAVTQGLLPGMVYGGSINYFGEGSVRCMHDLGLDALTSWCHAMGEPAGFPLLTGGPLIMLAALLMYLPGVDSLGAFIAAQLVFDVIAMAGAFKLMRKLGAGPWIALGTATAWCLSPTVVGLEGFGGTWVGYVLLPAYAWMDLVVMEALAEGRGRRLALLIAAYFAVRTGALFMDGYSFVASGLVSGCLWFVWLLRRDIAARWRLAGVGVLAGASVAALASYSSYRPVDFTTDPIETFRSMGLDLMTLVTPSNNIWFASKFGLAADHTDLWGDTTNAMYNYAGYVGVGLAAWYLFSHRRARIPLALAAAGVIALVLSFGPALKPDVDRTQAPTVYAMPAGQAPELPWAQAFVKLPGLQSMRASYRWYGVSRMVLIVLAGLGLAQLARAPGRRRQLGVLLLAGVAALEVLPTVPLFVRGYRDHYRDRAQVQREVSAPLDRVTRPGERVFFLNYDGTHNDFLVNYLASASRLRAYNAGGDKNVVFAIGRWPAEVRAMAAPGVGPPAVERALRSGKVDVVIAPFFHLQLNSAAWPPSPQTRSAAEAAFARLLTARGLEVERARWFATIRLRG